MKIQTHSEAETLRLGRQIGAQLRPPQTVLLEGSLGTGKTVLTRGIVAGLGGDSTQVSSPTFTLVNVYPTPAGPVYHLDLYRLETLKDLYSIGIEEILAQEAVVIIEWAEKLALPAQCPLRIQIQARDDRRDWVINPPLSLV